MSNRTFLLCNLFLLLLGVVVYAAGHFVGRDQAARRASQTELVAPSSLVEAPGYRAHRHPAGRADSEERFEQDGAEKRAD